MESLYTTGTQKNDRYSVHWFCGHCNTVLGANGFYYEFCPRHESCLSLTEEKIRRSIEERERES